MFEIEWIKFLQCAPPPSLILKALRKREKWEKLTPEIPFLASFKIKKVYFCQCCPHAHKNCVSKETPTTVKVPGHNGAKIFMNLHWFFPWISTFYHDFVLSISSDSFLLICSFWLITLGITRIFFVRLKTYYSLISIDYTHFGWVFNYIRHYRFHELSTCINLNSKEIIPIPTCVELTNQIQSCVI